MNKTWSLPSRSVQAYWRRETFEQMSTVKWTIYRTTKEKWSVFSVGAGEVAEASRKVSRRK